MQVAPLLAMVDDWQALLDSATPEQPLRELPDHTRIKFQFLPREQDA